MPDETKSKGNISKIIIIILVAIIAILLGLMVFFIQKADLFKKKTATPTATVQARTSKTATATKTADPTAGWKTYESTKYALQFKYPRDWADATESGNNAIEMIPIAFTNVNFGEDSTYGVELSKKTDYGDQSQDSIELLERVFNGEANDITTIWLPPGNAAIQANTIPKFIQSSDKSFRGIYYFANIGNGYSAIITGVAVLTDGKGNIIQISVNGESKKAGDYPCLQVGSTSCDSNNLQSEVDSFHDYVNSIDEATSDEPAIQDFQNTVKPIISSLKPF